MLYNILNANMHGVSSETYITDIEMVACSETY